MNKPLEYTGGSKDLGLLLVCGVMLAACDSGSSLSAPRLTTVTQAVQLTAGTTVMYRMANTGGRPDQCTLASGQSLPDGLVVNVSADGQTCRIVGTPTVVQARVDYTITASNEAGVSTASLPIVVAPSGTNDCSEGSAPSGRSQSYRMTFTSNWSVANNGGALPANAGFTEIVGLSHNRRYSLWVEGSVVGAGFENFIESGAVDALDTEISQQVSAGAVGIRFSAAALNSPAGSVDTRFTVTCEHPLVSLAMRLNGSPDWFTGVANVELLNARQQWQDQTQLMLVVYDGGTEVGDRFLTTGADSNPKLRVSQLTGNNAIGFTAGREVIGRLNLTRLATGSANP